MTETITETTPSTGLGPINIEALRDAKIVIVDDEPVNFKVAKKYLGSAGYSNFLVFRDPQGPTESRFGHRK